MKIHLVYTPITGDRMVKKMEELKVHILASYYFLRQHNPLKRKFLLDSGAYSAFTTGDVIDIDKYIEFIKKNKDRIEYYFGLDEIGNAEKTLENQKYMESKGLKPIPTFHANEDFKYLEEYCKNYDYIALGGVAQLRSRPKMMLWLKKCFSIIPKNVKVHGFAITSPYVVKRFPFYSVDSSSWTNAGRYGRMSLFDKQKMITMKTRVKSTTENNHKIIVWNLIQWKKYADYMEERKWNT